LRELSFGGGGIGAECVAAVADVDVPTVANVPGEPAVAVVAVVPEEVAAETGTGETGTGGMGAALACLGTLDGGVLHDDGV